MEGRRGAGARRGSGRASDAEQAHPLGTLTSLNSLFDGAFEGTSCSTDGVCA